MIMEDLPCDIQSEILSYVPDESVLDCKLVSKTWNTLLSHRKLAGGLLVYNGKRTGCGENTDITFRFGFYDEILKRGKDHGNSVTNETLTETTIFDRRIGFTSQLIGSCNGLVCLSIPDDNKISNDYVFNPVTGECFNLPKIEALVSGCGFNLYGFTVSGFGHDPCGRNYKVVKIYYPQEDPPSQFSRKEERLVYIYTLGGGDSRGWRHIGEVNCSFYSEGVLWNGSLHWLDKHQWKIVSFDLADEKFRYLPTTLPCINKRIWETQLKLLGGCLSVVSEDRDIKRTYIWLFKNEHKDDDNHEGYESWTWSLEFSIQPHRFSDHNKYYTSEPFAITKNNQVLLWYKYISYCSTPPVLCCYDPKIDTITAVNKIFNWDAYYYDCDVYGFGEFQGIPHVNSLVSLKSLGVDPITTNALFAAERM